MLMRHSLAHLESGMQVVSAGDGVTKSGVLTSVPGAFVASEICDLLATLLPTLGVKLHSREMVLAHDQPLGRRNLTSVEAIRGVLRKRHLQLLDGCPLCPSLSLSKYCRCVMSGVLRSCGSMVMCWHAWVRHFCSDLLLGLAIGECGWLVFG
jgi:hypothetical protein